MSNTSEQQNPITAALDKFAGWAKELNLADDEAEGFIEQAMEKAGFKRIQSWAAPEPAKDEKTNVSSFFGGKREERNVGGYRG